MKRISIITLLALSALLISVSCSIELGAPELRVTFVFNNGSEDEVKVVRKGRKVSEPSAPVYEGYTFVEWQKDGVKYDFDTPVTEDITLEAVWTERICSVTFVFNNGNDDKTGNVLYGEKVSVLPDVEYEGHIFAGWRKDGVAYDFDTPVTEDITLEAAWTGRICSVTFVFNNGSGNEVKPVPWGETVSAPSDVEYEGYTFAEWQKNGVKYDFDSPVTEDVSLEAVWTERICTVSFDFPDDCTDTPSDKNIPYGNKASEPYPTIKRVGYEFDGWYLGEEKYDFSKEVTDDITLTAGWKEQYWVVSFDLSPSTEKLPSLSIRDGEKINYAGDWQPEDLEWYKFEYWTNNGEYFPLDCAIRDDVSLKAKWIPYYAVTFDLTGVSGTVEPQKVLENGYATKPDNPESSSKYKTFDYWSTDGTKEFNFTKTQITGNITLYPVWKDKYTVGEKGPAGGIIIYDVDADNSDENNGAGPDDLSLEKNGWRYLEVAPEDAGTSTYLFGSNGEYATGEKKGDGKSNTEILLNAMSEVKTISFPAAETRNSYKAGGFMDWYLPSRDELNLMYTYKDKIGNMKEDRYWTSSTVGEINVYYRSFKDADNSYTLRDYSYYVRLIHQY